MPPRKQVDRTSAALNRISGKAQKAADRLIRASLDSDGRPVMSPRLVSSLVRVIEQAGDASASLAADLALAQLQRWEVEPQIERAAGVNAERAGARLRWAGTTDDVPANVALLVDELSKQPYRSTIADTAEASGVRWARVPSGPNPCGFCTMLASRGAVYHSEETAGYSDKKYHGNDNCVATLIRDEGDYPEGYDPDALYAEYNDARVSVGSNDPKAIGAEIDRRRAASEPADAPADTADAEPEPTWLFESIKDEDLTEYETVDLHDLHTAAQEAGDAGALSLTSAELARREKQTAGYRGTGYTREKLRAMYAEHVDRSYWAAEEATNGHMLTAEGRRAGIDPRSLFTGTDARALKYASDDLKYHWQTEHRVSFEAFVGDPDAVARSRTVDF